MTIYSVAFQTDCSFAVKDIEAGDIGEALVAARRIASDDPDELDFEAYQGRQAVNEIVIADENGNELGLWRDEDVLLSLAARDLLNAGRLVIASWHTGDLAGAVSEMAAAVAKAEGRKTQPRGGDSLPVNK